MSWARSAAGRQRPGRRAEGHAARLRAARGHEREARVLLVLPHAGHALEAGRGHEQGRLRVAHPERAEPLEVVGEVEPEVAAGHHGVDALHRDQVVRGQRRGRVGGERAAERLDGGGVQLHPGRHPVPAEAGQVLRAGGQPGVEVIGRDAAARAAPAALAVERDHHARPAPALHEPRGHDPHHSGVPALPRHHDRALVSLRRAGGLGGEQDAGLRLLAVAVQEVELARHLAGARVVVGEQQLEGGVGALHPPRRVDPRPEPEAERLLGQLAGGHAADLHQRSQAGLAGAPERHEALAHDAAVLAAQRHEVADRGERGQVDVLGGVARVAPGGGEERLAQLQHDARGAQLGAAVVARAPGGRRCSRAARRPDGGGR